MPYLLLGEGKQAEARQSVENMPKGVGFGRDLLQVCLNPNETQRLNEVAKEFETATIRERDPERRYSNGTLLAYCGQKDAAVRIVTSAVTDNYCAYGQLKRDPLAAKLREISEFPKLLSAAKACQDDFLSKRGQTRQ